MHVLQFLQPMLSTCHANGQAVGLKAHYPTPLCPRLLLLREPGSARVASTAGGRAAGASSILRIVTRVSHLFAPNKIFIASHVPQRDYDVLVGYGDLRVSGDL